MRRLLREPLLHFAVLGAALFVAYALVRRDDPETREIFVSGDQFAAIEAQFRATWQRPPTEAEMQGLVENHIRDEVLVREGLAMGLDRAAPRLMTSNCSLAVTIREKPHQPWIHSHG